MRHNPSPRRQRSAHWRWWLFLASLLACSCDKPTPPAATDAGVTVSEAPASGPFADLVLPERVVACGVVARQGDSWLPLRSPASTAGVRDAGPQASMWLTAVKQRFGLADAAFVAPDGSAHFALVEDAAGHLTPVFVSEVTSREQALAAMPSARREGVAGNAFAYSVAAATTYANFIDQHLVLTQHEGTFAEHAAFLRQLLGAQHGDGLEMTIAPARMAEVYRKPLEAMIANFAKAASAEQPLSLSAQASEWLHVLREVERLKLQVVLEAGVVVVRGVVEAKPASALHGHLKAMKPAPLPLLARVPQGAAAALVVGIDPRGPAAWRDTLSEWMTQAALADDKASKAYREARTALRDEASGDMMLALHEVARGKPRAGEVRAAGVSSDERLAVVSAMFGVREEAAARAALDKLHLAHEDAGVQQLYRALGVEPKARKAAYRVGEVPVDVMTATTLKPDPRKPSVPIHAATGALFQLLSAHTAVSGKRLIRTFGAAGESAMRAWLANEVAPFSGADELRAHAAPNAFLLGYADVAATSATVARLGASASGASTSDAAAASEPQRVIVSFGVAREHMTLRWEVPQRALTTWFDQLRRP